ncbi:hypothetical protein B0H14DRAFT_3461949 [Mycena olivaceomarginata]|nr:hypothetical protein B0H14DRAFT_3461949 [Mycena olivaceomarginata]
MSGSDESNEEDDLDAEERADLTHGYEPPRPLVAASEDAPMPEPGTDNIPAPAREIRKAAEDRFHHKPIVVKYPGNMAGKPISTTRDPTSEKAYESALKDGTSSNPYAPFTSKMDWEVAKWAKLRGACSTAFSDLMWPAISICPLIFHFSGFVHPLRGKDWAQHCSVELKQSLQTYPV